jgi:molybdate transport system permease protein
MTSDFVEALLLTLVLACTVTTLLLLLGVPLAWWLARTRARWAWAIEILVTVPLVLPPTVLGFYLLLLLSPANGLGQWWLALTGTQLTFNFTALVIGSVIFCLPFAVQPFHLAFQQIPVAHLESARVLGAPRWQTFWRIEIPSAKRGLAVGATLAFAHTIGEFGVVLMLGGSIPGSTRVASIALYDAVQRLDYVQAHAYAAVLVLVSLALMSVRWALDRTRNLR